MSNQPIAQSRADQQAGSWTALVRQTRSFEPSPPSQPVLLLGERGSGRTSLLNHVAWLLARQKEPRHTVLVSGELASNPSQLLGVLVARVQRLADPAGPRLAGSRICGRCRCRTGRSGRSRSRRS